MIFTQGVPWTVIFLPMLPKWLQLQMCTTTPKTWFVEMGSQQLTFCLGWLQTEIFLISAFQVSGITDMSYHASH
jgi:hypothetical protein